MHTTAQEEKKTQRVGVGVTPTEKRIAGQMVEVLEADSESELLRAHSLEHVLREYGKHVERLRELDPQLARTLGFTEDQGEGESLTMKIGVATTPTEKRVVGLMVDILQVGSESTLLRRYSLNEVIERYDRTLERVRSADPELARTLGEAEAA